MAVSRIQIASNKKSALLKQAMREIAVLLSEDAPREEKAKIKAEALIRDDDLIEAYEILQLECELLHERIKLIEYSNACPPDLVSVVSTLMWASRRVDIPELNQIRQQFRAKYGKKFQESAMNNVNGCLNERVVMKLSVDPPAAYLVQTYLERICEQFQVDWKPKVSLTATEMAEPMAAPVGYSVGVAQGTGLGPTPVLVNNSNPPLEQEVVVPPPVVTTATHVTPLPPPGGTSTVSSVTAKQDDFTEPDIFIPGPPSAPPGSNSQKSTTQSDNANTNDTSNDNDDEENNASAGIPPAAPGAGGINSGTGSYADLAARFDQLKK